MVEITEENLNDLKFDGIVIKAYSDGNIQFVFECAWRTDGKRSYIKAGQCESHDSSFYSLSYDPKSEYCNKGVYFNSSTRLSFNLMFEDFNKRSYKLYKFDTMEEFCKWYLDYIKPQEQKTWSQEKCGTNTPPTCIPEKPSVGNKKKQARREKYKDILTILELNDFIHDTKDMMTNVKNGHDPHTFEMLCKQLERCYNRLDEFLDEEIQ